MFRLPMEKALAKLASLSCDAAIIDLEDAVAPDDKGRGTGKSERTVRKAPGYRRRTCHPHQPAFRAIGAPTIFRPRLRCEPDGILLPKVETPRDILEVGDVLDDEAVPDTLKLWAMIETPPRPAQHRRDRRAWTRSGSRLAGLVAGTNDLVKDTGIRRRRTALSDAVADADRACRARRRSRRAGRCHERFPQCWMPSSGSAREAAAMGFDGKTLIHPSQIEPANTAFSPSPKRLRGPGNRRRLRSPPKTPARA